MSAWIVSKEHIDVLVKARSVYARSYWVATFDPDETGRMLWRENLRSLKARYPEDEDGERPGPIDFADEDVDLYVYTDPGFVPTLGEIFMAISCYEYQTCESDGWRQTEAAKWCRDLTAAVTSSLSEGPWGWNADEIAKRKGAQVPV